MTNIQAESNEKVNFQYSRFTYLEVTGAVISRVGGGGVTAMVNTGGEGLLSLDSTVSVCVSQTGIGGTAGSLGGGSTGGCSCFCNCSRCNRVVTPVTVLSIESMGSLGAPLVLAVAPLALFTFP